MKRLMLTAAMAAMVGAGVAAPVAASPWLVAAEAGTKETKVRFSTVSINQKEVMRLAEAADLHADERADKVQERIRMVVAPDPGEKFQPIQASDVTVESVNGAQVVRLRNQNIVQATPQDARLAGMTPDALAQQWADALRGALKEVKAARDGRLPENWLTVANGELTRPRGGGAGGTPRQQQDQQKDHQQKDHQQKDEPMRDQQPDRQDRDMER